MLITDLAIKNRTTVFVLVVMIVFAGVFSYISLPRESAPEVKVPNIIISTPYPGASPKDVENEVTNEIEQKLTGLSGLKEITSTSSEGMSIISVEFQPEVDIDVALQRVKDKVDLAKPELPTNTDDPVEPVVTDINISEFPIMDINLSGDISPARLRLIAEDLEEEIETLPGVLEVDVRGALEREIILEMDADRVSAYRLTMPELTTLVATENVNQSAGGLETEGIKFNIRVPAEFEDIKDINRLPLTVRDKRTIYLTDVANVKDSFKDRTNFSRLNSQDTITLSVKKRTGANILNLARAVKALLEEAREMLPPGVHIAIISDRSKDVTQMVSDLENNIMTGLLLVLAVLVMFMGLRSSVIVALAIPLSMLMSFAIIQAIGVTLNMVVLFGLILALGMLVDNAIVIVENIYRFRELGYDKLEAAKQGTAEVAWPVTASTATTVAAFSPLLFWPGIMGDFMQYIPLAVIIVLSSSLFVALIISPVVCSAFSGSKKQKVKKKAPGKFVQQYQRLLSTALKYPLTTLLLAAMVLVGVVILYGKLGRGQELFPKIDPDEVTVDIRAPQGTNIYETDRIAREIEDRIEPLKANPDGGKDLYENLLTKIGASGGGGGLSASSSGPHRGSVTVIYYDYEEREGSSVKHMEKVAEALKGIGGAEIKVQRREKGPPVGDDVEIRLIGEDMRELKHLSKKIMDSIKNVPNLRNLQSNLEAEKPELVFEPDRERIKKLGLSTSQISQFLKAAVYGTKVGEYRQLNDKYDIRIRLPLEQRKTLDDVLRLRVPGPTGEAIPITTLGKFVYRPGFGEIHRVNRKRVVTITGDAEGRLAKDVLTDVQAQMAKLEMTPGYRIEYAGKEERTQEAGGFLLKAFGVAILLIVAILVTQFNSLSAPLIIMTTVLLSLVGVFLGLLIFDLPFSIVMTGVGVISLAGVVVNNAIVLLDYTRQLQHRGLELIDAAIEAGTTRLRPVLLTATTTILGLIPMATGVSFDFHNMTLVTDSSSSQWWAQMAWAVIFGLAFATLLTLLVVPSLYVLMYRLSAKMNFTEGLAHSAAKEETAPISELEDY